MTTTKQWVVAVSLLLLLQARTNRAWYEGIQSGQRHQCEKLPAGERDECIRQLSTDYETYENERKKLESPGTVVDKNLTRLN